MMPFYKRIVQLLKSDNPAFRIKRTIIVSTLLLALTAFFIKGQFGNRTLGFVNASATPKSATPKVVFQHAAPGRINIEKLGVQICSPSLLGQTTVALRHTPAEVNGRKSIRRVVDIQPEHDTELDAELVFKYEEDELEGLDEQQLILYSSTDGGATWQAHPDSEVDPQSNSIHLSGIEHFSLWTAASMAAAFVVNSTADTDDGTCDTGDCTLREAINAANAEIGRAHV